MKPTPPWQDRKKFQKLYLEKDMTQEALAKHWNCSKPTIAHWVSRHGLSKQRSPVGQPRGATPSGILTGPALKITQIVGTWDVYPDGAKEVLRGELQELVAKLP